MRTTLTLDDDLAMMLKQKAEETGRPFRAVVNDAIRHGLDADEAVVSEDFEIPRPVSMGPPLMDLSQAIHILDEEYDEKKMRSGS